MDTKEKVLLGAEELFFRFGIKNITMDDIAKHLSMSKKTIYQYYADKDEIIHSLVKKKIDEDQDIFMNIKTKSVNIVEEIFMGTKAMRDIFSDCNPIVFYELQKFYPKTWKLFLDFKEKFLFDQVEKSIEKGISDGLVRNDINTKIMTKLRLEEMAMGFNQTVFPPDKYSIADVQAAMTEHFLYGICTLKGHKLMNKYKEVTEEE